MPLPPTQTIDISAPRKTPMPTVETSHTMDSNTEEQIPDVDEPPEIQHECTPRAIIPKSLTNSEPTFGKSVPSAYSKRTSLLTKILHSSESEDADEQYPANISRGLSNASTWSNPSTTSTAELTSDGGLTSPARTSTPSPPLPPTTFTIPLSKKPDSTHIVIHNPHVDEHIGPLDLTPASEQAVEATLGRKRCITFACGGKKENIKVETAKPAEEKPAEPAKRPCALRFVCPTRNEKAGSVPNGPTRRRLGSPPPPVKRSIHDSPKGHRAHRDSDSTIRNTSPKAVRKIPSAVRVRKFSNDPESRPGEATRFCEFANSDNEEDDWTQESTCYRNRLTIDDTLKIENNLRQLAQEAEDEAMEEADEDNESAEEDLDDDEDEDGDDVDDALGKAATYESESEDEGFQTDDEEGFAGSDDDSDDTGSEYDWWAPGRSTTATSTEPLDHIRPTSRRTLSRSSIESMEDGHVSPFSSPNATRQGRLIKKQKPVNLRSQSPELPDSTDFVCGTLDEDRPLEEAYKAELERRRAAKHKLTPQDIDPTFPTSELDEEDEDEEEVDFKPVVDESDQSSFLHGRLESHDEGNDTRSRKRSPKRLRSPPPPVKRGTHRSPPPRKLFGSSPRRLRSPPPPCRLRSPPPTRRTSFNKAESNGEAQHVLGQRPRPIYASSLPRNTHASGPYCLLPQFSRLNPDVNDEDEREVGSVGGSGLLASGAETSFPARGAIDIVKGLEKKRQRRREMLYQKHCRRAAAITGKDRDRAQKKPPPGKGAERMRYVGLGAAAYKGTLAAKNCVPTAMDGQRMHMLSY